MKALTALLLALLAGCANYATEQANAYRRGDFAQAERLALQAIRSGHELDKSWFNLGLTYQRTGRQAQAIRAYTMGARYGDPRSQQALVSLNQPVPAADLAQRGTDGIAAGLDGFNRGYGSGVTCTTFGDPDLRRTVCR